MASSSTEKNEHAKLDLTGKKLAVEDFTLGKTLGTGAFGRVRFVTHEASGNHYALKTLKKAAIMKQKQVDHVLNEKEILNEIKHSFIVNMYGTFHDERYVYMLLQYIVGGEFFTHLRKAGHFDNPTCLFYTAQMTLIFEYLHSKDIIYRDLKPENILLASKVSNTDVKISDFGLAKMSRDYPRRLPRSHSICGSDFYLAPEVIKQEEYGREIDIWAVGVITYVLLSGSLPFFHNVLHKLYRQIVERDLSFPEQAWKNVSKGALDFILRLLQVRAGDRLTGEQALAHPWLRGGNPGSSFSSFETPSQLGRSGSHVNPGPLGSAHLLNPGMRGPEMESQPKMLHPLEHAHKVNSKGQEQHMHPQPVMSGHRPMVGQAPYGMRPMSQGHAPYR
mmetsp:Transcript_45123/g.98599  ORF Transcript_45123/g.98599 Transcript_45123/m.98599 type:complete len:390 (-) Transcript_45123:108-1277(-)